MSKFTDYFAELNQVNLAGIEELTPKFEARQENLKVLSQIKVRLGNNPSKQAEYLQGLAREASHIFEDEKRYRDYWLDYVGNVIETKVRWALFDGEVSQKELSIILVSTRELGVPDDVALKKIRIIVKEKNGTIEPPDSARRRQFGQPPPGTQPPPQPQPHSKSGASASQRSSTSAGSYSTGAGAFSGIDNLTPFEKANIASSIAGTLGLLYVLLKVTWVPLNWWGLLIPATAALLSIKNANIPIKRHAWSLVAILFLYFWNSALLIVLIPTFLLWHWSPIVFSKLKLRPSYVWILPLVLCFGVYSTSYAIKRVPRRATQRHEGQSQQSTPRQSQPFVTQKAPATSTHNPEKHSPLPKTVTPPKTEEPKSRPTTTERKTVTYVFNADSSAFELYSSEGIQGTGILVSKGDSMTIDVSDKTTVVWCEGEEPVGPSGSSAIALSRNNGTRFFVPQSPCGAVIGKIGNAGKWFCVGKQYSAQADRDGELFLTINDLPDGFGDNFGFFQLRITIKRKVPKTASLFAPDLDKLLSHGDEVHSINGAIQSLGSS